MILFWPHLDYRVARLHLSIEALKNIDPEASGIKQALFRNQTLIIVTLPVTIRKCPFFDLLRVNAIFEGYSTHVMRRK